MSLDVYLIVPGSQVPVEPNQIWVREDGTLRQLTRAEWDQRFPGREPVTVTPIMRTTDVVWHANITHNLGAMAQACGVYETCWRPEELGITRAGDLVARLTQGLETLCQLWDDMAVHEPANGWGTRETLREFLEDYRATCAHWPEATIEVSR